MPAAVPESAPDAADRTVVAASPDGGNAPDVIAPPPRGDRPDGAAAAPPGKVAIFVAQGMGGRTTISCDEGRTWVANRSWELDADPLVCGSTQPIACFTGTCSYRINNQCQQRGCCNDTPDVAKGVIYGEQFVATWGWGQPGAVRRSTNGIDWVTTFPNDSFGGLAFGKGTFVAASRSPITSPDGMAWTKSQPADFRNADGTQMWSVRRFAYADFQTGRFVAVASGDTSRDMLVSADLGKSWRRPRVIPATCAISVSPYGGIVYGNGAIVIVDQMGNACRSTDGGETWTVAPTGASQVLSHGVWTGNEFQFWGDNGSMLSSADGATWKKTPMLTRVNLGPLARAASGTLVAVGNVWEGYGKQQFLRSTDGLTWQRLPATAFAASHPIFYITAGYANPSAVCPAPK